MRSIAAHWGISRNTVAKTVSSDSPPAYVRAYQNSGIMALEPAIPALLVESPRMPATVLAERVGWSGSPAWFRENEARIRPEYAPADPADLCHTPESTNWDGSVMVRATFRAPFKGSLAAVSRAPKAR